MRIFEKTHSGTSFAVEVNPEDKKKSSSGEASTTTAPTTTQSPPTSSVPPTTTVASTTTEAPAANLAPALSVPTAIQEADVYGQAASNLVAGNSFEEAMQILDMGGGTGDRDTVIRDLLAAFNNPERAVDYLYSDPPKGSVPPTTTVASTTAEALAANLAQAPSDPAPLFVPGDLIISILSKSSFQTLVQSTIISKEWNKLIKESKEYLGFLDEAHSWFFSIVKQEMGTTAHLSTYNHDKRDFIVTTNLQLPQVKSRLQWNRGFGVLRDQIQRHKCLNQLLGETNGLVAIGSLEYKVIDPIIIFNPFHGSLVELPPLEEKYKKVYRCAIGFGYVRKKEQYVLVRIMFRVNYRDQIRAKIFTFKIGSSEKWEFKGLLPYMFSDFLFHGVAIDENIYFLDTDRRILSFNLEAEKCFEVRPPPLGIGVNDRCSVSLGKLDNKLCLVKLDFSNKDTVVFIKREDAWEVYRHNNSNPFTLTNHSLVGLPILGNIVWWVENGVLVFQNFRGPSYRKDFRNRGENCDMEFIHYTPRWKRK